MFTRNAHLFSRILLALVLCGVFSRIQSNDQYNNTSNEIWITVFIHGTLGLRYTLGPYTILRLFLDNPEHTQYAETVHVLRHNPVFYKSQSLQEMGLRRICRSERTLGSWLLSTIYDDIQQTYAPRPTVYYTFGWSGILSKTERYHAAIHLYQQLKEIYQYWQDHGYNPHFSLLGYSHGGTVAQYLPLFHANDHQPSFDTIDELILLATPIQRATDCYTTWSLFKTVYNIYSRTDYFQRLDIISGQQWFPQRRLRDSARCRITDNIYQIELQITMPPLCNGYYDLYRKGKHRKKRSPSHFEQFILCFPGSTELYREDFPLLPLPTMVLTPALIAQKHHFPNTDLVCEYWPIEGDIVIRPRHTCYGQRYPFIPYETLQDYRVFAWNHRPPMYTHTLSDYAARKAHNIVHKTWKDLYNKC